MKPTGGASGSGTTTGVRTRDQLLRARLRGAAAVARRLLIERQAEGDMYRLLFCDGELLDAVRRRPPRVTGDGRSHHPRADRGRERLAARSGPSGLDADPARRPRLPVRARGRRPVAASPCFPTDATVAVKTVTSQNRDRGQRDGPRADCARSGRRGAPGRGASGGAPGRRGLNNHRFEPITKGVRRRDNRGQRHPGASLPLSSRRSKQMPRRVAVPILRRLLEESRR